MGYSNVTCALARSRALVFILRARACMLALARSRALALTALARVTCACALARSRLVAHGRTLARSVSMQASIYLAEEVFAHGQLYVAASRVSPPHHIRFALLRFPRYTWTEHCVQRSPRLKQKCSTALLTSCKRPNKLYAVVFQINVNVPLWCCCACYLHSN